VKLHNFPLRLALLAIGLGLSQISLRAQDVGADTAINDPTPPGVRIYPNLAYVEGGSPHQTLDLYLPFPVPAKPMPLIVYLHGGGWQKGSKADGRRFAFRMVPKGYAIACADYRLANEDLFPAQLEDCKAAVRYLRGYAARYRIDIDRVGVVGVSAGGYLAVMLGVTREVHLFDSGGHLDQSSTVSAVCDFFGPTDLLQLYEYAKEHGTPQAQEVHDLLGTNPRVDANLAKRANPLTYVQSDTPAVLMIHGAEDTVVPPEQSRLLFDAMAKMKAPVRLHLIHGAGHTGPAFVAPEINARVDDFFDRIFEPEKYSWAPPGAVLTESTAAKN